MDAFDIYQTRPAADATQTGGNTNMTMDRERILKLIEEDALELYGQPKWTFGKNTCNTYEVFAEKIRQPNGESVPARELIDAVEADEELTRLFYAWFMERAMQTAVRLTAETDSNVTLSINVLAAQANEALAWEAALPAAKMDETGALVPSVTTFTRTLTLMPGGESAQGTVTAEMNVGSRFYRQSLPMALCVADISAKTSVTGAENGRLTAGKTMAYAVEIANAGTAEKTVPVELILPADVTLSGDLPEGFTRSQRQICGEVKASAAAGDEPFTTTLVFPMTVNEDALDGDEDAMRLLTGALRVDGKRVALPRVQLCGAKISARLLPQMDSLKAGETMALRVVLVNSGLAGADVRVS